MIKKLIFTIVFAVGVFTLLITGLSIVHAQDNMMESYPQAGATNLTQIFGEPIYKRQVASQVIQ